MKGIKPARERPTELQVSVLVALAGGEEYVSRIRWHSYIHAPQEKCGRGEILFTTWDGRLIANYTVKALIRDGYIRPADEDNEIPFRSGNEPYRDYRITDRGRRVAQKFSPKGEAA